MISVIDKQELDRWYHTLKVEMMKIYVYACIIRNEITEAKRVRPNTILLMVFRISGF